MPDSSFLSALTLPYPQSRAPACPPWSPARLAPPSGPASFVKHFYRHQVSTCPGQGLGQQWAGGAGIWGWGKNSLSQSEGCGRAWRAQEGLCYLPYAWGISEKSSLP